MITGEKIESLDDLEKVAGGKISIKNRVLPGVLSLLMVGGNLVPGLDKLNIYPKSEAEATGTQINISLEIPPPYKMEEIIALINSDATLRDMFGIEKDKNLVTLTTETWEREVKTPYTEKSAVLPVVGAGAIDVFDYALPAILKSWASDTSYVVNLETLKTKLLSDKHIGGLFSEIYGQIPNVWIFGDFRGAFRKYIPNVAYPKDLKLKGESEGAYAIRRNKSVAVNKLLACYVFTIMEKHGLDTTMLKQIVNQKPHLLNTYFGYFTSLNASQYSDEYNKEVLSANKYVLQDLLPSYGELCKSLEQSKNELLEVLCNRFPEVRKVKQIIEDVGTLFSRGNPEGAPAAIQKAIYLLNELTGWHYTEETMNKIKTHLENIAKADKAQDVLGELQELKKIHEERLAKLKSGKKNTKNEEKETVKLGNLKSSNENRLAESDSKRTEGINYEGTTKQIMLDELMNTLCKKAERLETAHSMSDGSFNPERVVPEIRKLSDEILTFIKENQSVKEHLDNILQDTRSLLNKLNDNDGSLQKVLRNLDTGLKILEEQNFFGEVAALPAELKNLKDAVLTEWESLKSGAGLLGRANTIASNLERITGFIANPWFASVVLGAAGAALLEGTTGVFSKLLKGSMSCAKSAFANIRKSYNENIYNKLVLENDPIKLKKMVSEYLKSTLMFPGQISDNLAEILSSGTMSSGKPTMLELSGNVSSGVFSAVHKSVFKNNLETWQTINQSRIKPRIITRNLENGAKEKIELSLADTIFNTTNLVIKKLLNNTSTTLVLENLTDSSIIDRLEEVRHNNGVLRLYDNNSGDYVEHDASNTLFLISDRNNTDQHDQLKFAEQVHFGDFTEEEYAYIVAEKLGDMSASYYDKYKITVDFSDDFVENIARKAVKDHAGYDDTEKYLKPVTPAMIQFLDTEKSEGRPIKKLKLECYEENEKIMFRHQEVLEKQKDVDQIEEISDGHSGDFLETREF
ncbi:MAG: hypothetical protein IJC57_01940 [Clostridia bacterium]|nr:hypothetical protein [Clostridia bacterium]